MLKFFKNIASWIMLFLAGSYCLAQSGSETWCPPQACSGCDRTISSNASKVEVEDDEKVCFTGNFTFTGNIEMEGGILCVEEGVTISVNNLEELKGDWTIHNHGTIRISKEFKIRNDQSFFNYGIFQILTVDEMVIEAGGLFCNSGEALLAGDLVNRGELYSSGFLEVGDEFKNDVSGEAWITQMVVTDEISNLGTIYLEGFIESLNKSFKNFEGSSVIGLDHPCNAIKAKNEVENNGIIDGTGGPVVIGVDEDDYNQGGTGSLMGDVVFADTPGLSEDCFRILPVEWSEFEVVFSESSKVVSINWETLKEWNNSHFEVQRSYLGIDDWKIIGEVKGMGWTDAVTEYAFEDKNLPISGGMVYYRVKQVDFDGKSEYSSVVSVNLPKLHFTQGVWRAFPNPTNGEQLRIGLLDRNEYMGERLTFRIIQTTAYSPAISVSDEAEMNEILATMIPKIPKGLFVVEIRWGQKVEHIKVLRK